jgi:putative DNA primase/helicase
MGTVNLQKGTERAPCQLDYITQKTACSIAPPGTPHPLWSSFLDRITDHNGELAGFLQRYIGYCTTGIISEHVFVFAYGTGANGKGTFINTIAKILGDYATVASMGTFISSKNESHPTDLAKLRGARLVVAQETQQGREWDEAKIKTLTGGDRVTARFMRRDFFDFDPTFKLFIVGNHKPRLTIVDEAMRRRLLLVPFTVQIPKEERDPDLTHKLEKEWPAILRWAVDGCLEWQRIGLSPPRVVLDATNSYFEAEDLFGQWLEEDCDVEPDNEFKWESVGMLFEAWSGYASRVNENPGSVKAFSELMQARNFHKCAKGHAKTRSFAGIRLKHKKAPRFSED